MSDSEEDIPDSPFSWKPSTYNPYAAALFLTYVGNPFSFFVVDDRISKQRLEDLIIEYGGDVCTESVGLTSIILVNEKCRVDESWGPVYSREYVRDCVSAFNLLCLEDYLMKGCRPPDCSHVMRGLYEGRFTFRNSPLTISKFSKIWLPNVNTVLTPSPSDTTLHQNPIEVGTARVDPAENESDSEGNATSSMPVHSIEEGIARVDPAENESDSEGNATSSMPVHSIEEGIARVDPAENESDSEGNATSSMPVHSIEEGIARVDPAENVSDSEGNATSSIPVLANSETKKKDEVNNHLSGSRKKIKLPFSGINVSFIQSSDDPANPSSSQPQNNNTKNKKQSTINPELADPFDSSDENSLNPRPSVSAQANRIQRDNIQDSSDSDDCLPDLNRWTRFPSVSKYDRVNKHTKTRFSKHEKEAILKYIVSTRSYTRLKSDALYREMESKNICPKRTYQSLKNHFIKTLLNELDMYEFLTDNVKRKLRGEVW